MLTPQQYREKQANNLKNSTESIKLGVQNVTTPPSQSAIKAKDKMKRNLIASVDDGSWERGLQKVSLEDWKNKITDVGIPRISAGIDAAAPKVEAFASKFLPFADAVSKKVETMPSLTLDDSINRAATAIRELAKFKM